MKAMTVPSDAPSATSANRPEAERSRREEIDRRLAERETRPTDGLQELVDSQDEFRARMKEHVRKITGR